MHGDHNLMVFTFTTEGQDCRIHLLNFLIFSVVRVVTLTGFDFSSWQFFFLSRLIKQLLRLLPLLSAVVCTIAWFVVFGQIVACLWSAFGSTARHIPAPKRYSLFVPVKQVVVLGIAWQLGTWKDWRRHLTARLSLWRKIKRNDKWRSFLPSTICPLKQIVPTSFHRSAKNGGVANSVDAFNALNCSGERCRAGLNISSSSLTERLSHPSPTLRPLLAARALWDAWGWPGTSAVHKTANEADETQRTRCGLLTEEVDKEISRRRRKMHYSPNLHKEKTA